MGCSSCGTGGSKGCKSNGDCSTGGCNKLNTYDWLSDLIMPDYGNTFQVVEVRFKGSRKEFYLNEDNLDLFKGDFVTVQSDFGYDLGEVSLTGEMVRLQLKKKNIDYHQVQFPTIYRKSSEKDLNLFKELRNNESEALEKARGIALNLKVAMKLSDIEYQADGKKIIFYYTSEGRVDFRELIKRFATEFKARIEMRQVSYREEASRLGGIGVCGRVLCCSTWLTDYKIVSVNAAKKQNLSINMLKLSGQCGRLKCCLNYELDTYLEILDDFPRIDNLELDTFAGVAALQKTDILKKTLWFSYPNNTDWIPLSLDKVNEIVKINKKGEKAPAIYKESANKVMEFSGRKIDLAENDLASKIDPKTIEKNRKKSKGGSRKNKNPSSNNNSTSVKSEKNKKPNNRKRNNRNRGGSKPNNQKPKE